MLSTKSKRAITLDTGNTYTVWVVAFHPDGMHLLSGSDDGLRRWRVADGQEVGKQQLDPTRAISVSRDHKWVVCGTNQGASVWDAKIQEKAIEVEDTNFVNAVDISPDTTKFATGIGIGDHTASIWDIVTGKRLVGPLQHVGSIVGVKFSPNGQQIATACQDSIRVFDGRSGDHLSTIKADVNSERLTITPLAWSNNGEQIFTASGKRIIKAFEVSTGSLLAESQVDGSHTGSDRDFRPSIALAANEKFISSFSRRSISFWNASTLVRIGSPIQVEGGEDIRSIALSADCNYLAIGSSKGKITIRNLGDILPGSYDPFHAPEHEGYDMKPHEDGPQQQQDERGSTSEIHDNKTPDPTPEQPVTTGPPDSENHGEVGGDDALKIEVPSSVPEPLFDFDEPPSPGSSVHHHEREVIPPSSSQAISSLPAALPVTSPSGACPEELADTAESSGVISAVKRWLQRVMKRSKKGQDPHQPDYLPKQPGRRANPRCRFGLWASGRNANVRPSSMTATKRQLQSVAVYIEEEPAKGERPKNDTAAAEASHSDKAASSSGQGRADLKKGQQENDTSQPLSIPRGIHVIQQEASNVTVSIGCQFNIPTWVSCQRPLRDEGTH